MYEFLNCKNFDWLYIFMLLFVMKEKSIRRRKNILKLKFHKLKYRAKRNKIKVFGNIYTHSQTYKSFVILCTVHYYIHYTYIYTTI